MRSKVERRSRVSSLSRVVSCPERRGLVIQSAAKRAIVLVDGDKGDVEGHCANAQQLTVPLP